MLDRLIMLFYYWYIGRKNIRWHSDWKDTLVYEMIRGQVVENVHEHYDDEPWIGISFTNGYRLYVWRGMIRYEGIGDHDYAYRVFTYSRHDGEDE